MYTVRESVKEQGKGILGTVFGASMVGAGKAMIKTGNPLCIVTGCGFALVGACVELSSIKRTVNGVIDTVFVDEEETEDVNENVNVEC